ncbi:unnamed protein product [Rotaria magnacalcarata]|uniref:G-protein coupled receptors family 1 profile domain-containing protein n=1 Tax=Rotaria magnacalcarata TaxID=392030 RepID=A0A816TBP9_9BILA|nr:unnamed protein product [Rotaria magnacalcarata]CAF2097393.1 unnamed protein product [Rotaria magnacalcarata]CAF3932606.1 unnamed protein product [Rotaria magnacalcarata]CAF4314196.1 unnamed protein product [Rotaria magnacalcarata]
MITKYVDLTSTPEKLGLLVFIFAIVMGNICAFVTFCVRGDKKYWSNMLILGMAFIDLFIGSFVLPLRYLNTYGNPLTLKLCTALRIGESCALAAVVYAIFIMIYARLYNLKRPSVVIHRHYLLILLLSSWIVFFLFYGIPFMIDYSNYSLSITSTKTINVTSCCTTYTTSIYHSPWMAYIEIGIIYSIPLMFISIGLIYLLHCICQPRPKRLGPTERKIYLEEQKTTWHVFLLGITFIFLWVPWMSVRILIIFYNTYTIQLVLQITYYILLLKSVLFPIVYASTNASFRGSFALYKHQRITFAVRVSAIDDQHEYSPKSRRGY